MAAIVKGLLTGLVVLAATSGIASGQSGAVVDGPEVVWNHSLWGKPRSFTAEVEGLAKFLDERTGGKFQYNIHWGTLSQPRDNLDGIAVGAFQAANFSSNYYPGKVEASTGLDLPFLPIETLHQLARVSDEYMEVPTVRDEFRKWNAMYYMSTAIPLYEVVGKGKPPETFDDWKGMRVRALGLMADAFREIGIAPIATPPGDVFMAMDRGLVDAAAFAYYAHLSYRTYEAADWYTNGLKVTTGAASGMMFNVDAYEALPEQYRALLEEYKAEHGYPLQIAAYEIEQAKAPQVFQEAGLKEVVIPPEEREKLADAGAPPVWKAWVEKMNGQGYDGQALLDFILDSAERHRDASF